jgi:hypothetical protein
MLRLNSRFLLVTGLLVLSAFVASAGGLQRIGHTTLVPRHSNPDDKGMYASVIDPANGYAYFVGNYLVKLDLTGPLPMQVGPALFTGQFAGGAIDPAAGYAYFPGASVKRFALGAGATAVSPAGSLTLSAGNASSIVIDDSDPNPANHYAYVVCSGTPSKVVKVALATFTEVGSVTLAAGENSFLLNPLVDTGKGYAYFVGSPPSTAAQVVKVKMTPGASPPVRIGAVNLDTASGFMDGASIDTMHGYAYYGTYHSDPSVLGKVYKVKLEDGDVAPTLVGSINLQMGEGRLAASVIDPLNGYVYFADDNTYPGRIYQLSLNGSNLPIEVGYLQLQGGTSSTTPPNGTTIQNASTDSDLPYGEVFFRTAVFDPVRGYAYFGQDSRPNQVVKVQLATHSPPQLLNLSTRLRVQTDPNELIGGFIITGPDAKKVVIRGIGPSLAPSIGNALADPTLELYQGNTLVASNDNWKETQAEIEATGVAPSHDLESAIVRTLDPGAYTAVLRDKNSTAGIGLVEAYDLDQAANSALLNISTRGFVDTDNNVMIGGFIIGPAGGTSAKVVVRAIGPSLGNFGITNALEDPTLDLVNSNGVVVRSNNNWKEFQQAEITAAGLQPSDDRESALVETVGPGNYTAIVRGNENTTGVGVVEVYLLQ